jgi:ribonuclease HI
MGRTTNSAELFALHFLMKLAVNKGILHLQVFGDSLMVIKWMNNEQAICWISLQALGDHLKDFSSQFTKITFIHIYRELILWHTLYRRREYN